MATAPARIIISAQTVAKMGRRMKKSTNIAPSTSQLFPAGCKYSPHPIAAGKQFRKISCGSGCPARIPGSLDDRRAIQQVLRAFHDDVISGLDAVQDRIFVADDLAQAHQFLAGDGGGAAFHHPDEKLTVDS